MDPGTSGSPNMMNSAAKLGGAFVNVMFLPKLANPLSGQIAAGVLIFQVLRAHLPINEWVANLVGFVPGQSATGFRGKQAGFKRDDFAANLPFAPAGQGFLANGIGGTVDPLADVLSSD